MQMVTLSKIALSTLVLISLNACLPDGVDTNNTGSSSSPSDNQVNNESELVEIVLAGTNQFAQTHLINENETRFAPLLSEKKDTLFIFTAEGDVNFTSGRIEVFENGVSRGTIPLQQIGDESNYLEQSATSSDLGIVSQGGWQATIPWYVMSWSTSVSVTLFTSENTFGTVDNINLPVQAPDFTYFMALNTISAFSNERYTQFSYDLTEVAPRYAKDYYAILPFSKLIKSDHTQAIWPELVINSDGKAKRFDSVDALEADPLASNDTYTIVKNHLAQRQMSANSGEGLKYDRYDISSTFTFGNYATFGMRRKVDGTYQNIHTGSAAGGWVGWSALWGHGTNIYAHEVGHNFRMSHWFDASYRNATVSAEYTGGQEHLDTLPIPYDSTRGMFKTTRLIKNGVVQTHSDGRTKGYSDHMSYDYHKNPVVSFNHYTPYSTKQIQDMTLSRPSLQGVDGKWSAYMWDEDSKLYIDSYYAFSSDIQEPVKTGVEVATVIGTISNQVEGQYLYPLTFNRYGNVYKFHDSLAETEYEPATFPFYIKLTFLDGSNKFESINITPVDASRPFGFNVAIEDNIDFVELYKENTLIQQLSIPSKVPDDTPITYFMGRGVNDITGNLNFVVECFDTLCNYNDESAWKYKTKNGQLDITPLGTAVTHFDDHSVITLDNSAEIKAFRFKSSSPSVTRSLATQPSDWALTDEENVKFELMPNSSFPLTSSKVMVKIKDGVGDRKTESFVNYAHKSNDITANIALGKPTRQSSSYSGDDSGKVVDGDLASYNHTNCQVGDWVEVDLEYEFNLTKLKLTHRNTWMSRMNGSKIVALNTSREEVWSTTVSGAYVWEYEAGLGTDGFNGNNIRFIRIEKDDCIHWTEIEAYIDPAYS